MKNCLALHLQRNKWNTHSKIKILQNVLLKIGKLVLKQTKFLSKKVEERNKTIKKIEEQNQLILDAENKRNKDEIDLFFKSLDLSFKKLPRIAIKETKLRALNMVNELEEKYGDHSQHTIPAFYPIQPNYNFEFSNSGTPPRTISYSMTDTQSTLSASPDLFQTSIANTSSFSLAPFNNEV